MNTIAAVLIVAMSLGFTNIVRADTGGGQVQLPLEVYAHLVERSSATPRPAPVGFAIGQAAIRVIVPEAGTHTTAEVTADLSIAVFEDQWVLVPILPAGTAVSSVQIAGSAVQLVYTPDGLAWGVNKAGTYAMHVSYRADAVHTEAGATLSLPVPQVAAMTLIATLPGTGLDVAVIPSAGARISSSNNQTVVSASVPTCSGIQISWRTELAQRHSISRAHYTGKLVNSAVVWTGEFVVELPSDEPITLTLLPTTTALSELRVDGKDTPITVVDDRFATRVRGRGVHTVVASFQVPVQHGDGPPQVHLDIPEVPVSRFDLTLPGKKAVVVTPAANVTTEEHDHATIATVNVPMTSAVSLSWTAAVPIDVKAETVASASLFHTVQAAEGVLAMRTLITYEVTRGERSALELEVPAGVQINRIAAASGGVADWRIARNEPGKPLLVSVFFDRPLHGTIDVEVTYDRALGSGEHDNDRIHVPLLHVLDVSRQRGMIALLTSKELTLTPIEEGQVTRIGENQLPPTVRQTIDLKIAHTFKYVEGEPALVVAVAAPARIPGKFDAEVDTLISLGDAILKGSASIDINIKSGSLSALQLELPPQVSLLSLTAPSRRSHTIAAVEGHQVVDVQFTQEMEGQFRLEVGYERILADANAEVAVPTITVRGAEVEQGRIGVEALSAVEVRTAAAQQLSTLDPSELPQQLILKTTNPILQAYQYVHADPPYRLALQLTHHKAIDVQAATIDAAEYQTLFTRDGVAVTAATFSMRNSREQFLRVRLPHGSQVWAAFVDGVAEKPALADDTAADGGSQVLIKILNSTRSFPVRLVYATGVASMRHLGIIGSELPRPNMIVTQSRWEVYLPDDLRYGRPVSNMDLVEPATIVSSERMQARLVDLSQSLGQQQTAGALPLPITVPRAGTRFVFEKLYASQSATASRFTLPYTSATGTALGWLVSLVATALFWCGITLAVRSGARLSRAASIVAATLGAATLIISLGYYDLSPLPALAASVPLLLLALRAYAHRQRHEDQPVESVPRFQ